MKLIAYRVVEASLLAPTIMSVTLEPLHPTEAISYQPTQYVMVSIGKSSPFPCSIANPPKASGKIEFHLRKWDSFLETDLVYLEGPYGGWHINPDRPCLFLAGGTGIVPVLSLLYPPIDSVSCTDVMPAKHRDNGARGGNQSNKKNLTRTVLYWGVKTAEDLYLQPEGLEFHPVISGEVHEAVLKDIPDLSAWQVFASGPLEMVEKAYATFTAHGLPPQYFYSDMMKSPPLQK